jgi:hypothetical protein
VVQDVTKASNVKLKIFIKVTTIDQWHLRVLTN